MCLQELLGKREAGALWSFSIMLGRSQRYQEQERPSTIATGIGLLLNKQLKGQVAYSLGRKTRAGIRNRGLDFASAAWVGVSRVLS